MNLFMRTKDEARVLYARALKSTGVEGANGMRAKEEFRNEMVALAGSLGAGTQATDAGVVPRICGGPRDWSAISDGANAHI